MKKWIMAFLLLEGVYSIHAQQLTMAEVFKAMPDSLMPYLSKNSRLDMIDFMEAGMRAEVTNLLEGDSEMTLLTSDSLSLRMNDVLTIDMQLVGVSEPVDNSLQVVRIVRTYTLNERQAVGIVDTYSTAWRLLSSQTVNSSLLLPDEELFSPLPQR